MNIKNKRVSLNMTQYELSKKLNVTRSTVAMWENGEAFPRADKLPALAEILKCSIEDLFESKST